MKAPSFWNNPQSKLGCLLNPIGKIYGWSVARRFKKAHPYQADIPVICVGNLSVGGTGKTPVSLALGKILKGMAIPFYFLNHGYKSRENGVVIDKTMTSFDVGDEAMLLADLAPTVVDRHRARGAQIAQRAGAKAIIMDDGFQNPSLIKTLSFIVVDGKTGFGNNRMIPAGPLREPVSKGLARADAVIVSGKDERGLVQSLKQNYPDLPVITGHFEPDKQILEQYRGKQVMTFCGIGRPSKFYDMLAEYGVQIVRITSFPDHYFYTRFDIEQLLSEAGQLPLLTTRKDYVKIPSELRSNIIVIDGNFMFDRLEEVEKLLKGVL